MYRLKAGIISNHRTTPFLVSEMAKSDSEQQQGMVELAKWWPKSFGDFTNDPDALVTLQNYGGKFFRFLNASYITNKGTEREMLEAVGPIL